MPTVPQEDSATSQIAALSRRGAFVKTAFVPSHKATSDRLRDERKKLSQWLGPVISRAAERSGRRFTIQTISATADKGVVISAVVTRTQEDETL